MAKRTQKKAGSRERSSRSKSSSGSDASSARLTVRKTYKMFIGGSFVRSESGRTWTVAGRPRDASDAHANIPRASRKDARDAVTAARVAWDGWSSRSAFNRGQVLYRLGEMLDARGPEFIALLRESGRSAPSARREVLATIDRTIAYSGWTDKYQSLCSSFNPVSGPHFNFTVPESMGVVVIAAPSRPALLGLVGALLPVITSGNTCVVLASEADPRTAMHLCEVLATSDLPAGVVNVLTGKGSEVLPHLAQHMEVAALDLHGVETALSKTLEAGAASNVKRVRSRNLDLEQWHDSQSAESPRWIEQFVELKTVWHPCGG